MEVEDNGFVVGEDCAVFGVCEAVGVVAIGDELGKLLVDIKEEEEEEEEVEVVVVVVVKLP
jgi:hypothetical protein